MVGVAFSVERGKVILGGNMAMSKVAATERSEERYELLGNQVVSVTIEPHNYWADSKTVSARMINLSSSGARLALPVDLPRDIAIRIKLTIEEFALTMYVSGTVCWSAMESADGSIIGCRLNPNIPASILQHIAQTGRLDRRDEDRRPTSCAVEVLRRIAPRGAFESADMVNYSEGGVCLEASQSATLGERLGLRIAGRAAKFDVLVRWELEQGERRLIGCEYVDPATFADLQAVLSA